MEDQLASDLYNAVVQPETIWFDDLPEVAKEGWRRAAKVAALAHDQDAVIAFNAEELGAFDDLEEAAGRIIEWGPVGNRDQLILGLHLIQQFIVMHMLQRYNVPGINHWFKEARDPFASVDEGLVKVDESD